MEYLNKMKWPLQSHSLKYNNIRLIGRNFWLSYATKETDKSLIVVTWLFTPIYYGIFFSPAAMKQEIQRAEHGKAKTWSQEAQELSKE
jgi:hypothetical protein